MRLRNWPWALVAAAAAALAIRLTVRDGTPVTAAVFYATPPAALVALCVVPLAVMVRRARAACDPATRRRARFVAFAAAALASGGAADLVATTVRAARDSPPGAVRALHWNVFSARLKWHRLIPVIQAQDPDVVWLSEANGGAAYADDTIPRTFPEHTWLREDGGMAALVRGSVAVVESVPLPHGGRAVVERITVRGRTLHVLRVDLESNPLHDRRASFERLDALCARYEDGPFLVVGDFNTPPDSVCFDSWRGPLVRAFEAAGRGWDATWPVPFPVLALDHVWASRSLTIRSCEHLWTVLSDHRPVLFTFD